MTPALRPFSPKLADKSIVYQPTTTPGNKPIGVGHAYSLLACLPEKNSTAPWVLPLDMQRVCTTEKGHEVGIDQFIACVAENKSVVAEKMCVVTGDRSYFVPSNQEKVEAVENLILISRMKSNRKVYARYQGKGNKKYDKRMTLNDPTSHMTPDQILSYCIETTRGKRYQVTIKCWHDRIRRGTKTFKGYEHPFHRVQCVLTDAQTGHRIYQRPLWLAVCGKRRDNLPLDQVFQSYDQRYDLEHYFRFSKQHLLIDTFQTSDVEHEQNGWQMAQLAYVQLYLARTEITALPHPWERYGAQYRAVQKEASPSQIKKCFDVVLDQIGTPAHDVRGSKAGKGRELGQRQEKRQDHPIIFKTVKKDTDKKTNANASKKVENPEVSGLELPNKLPKPQKFDEWLNYVKGLLKQSEINCKVFAEKLKEPEAFAT